MAKIILTTLFITLLALQIYDAWSTIKILNAGGKELNKPLAKLMDIVGVVPALMLAKCIAIGAGAFLSFFPLINPGIAVTLMLVINAFYVWVMLNYNSKHIQKLD